MQDIGALPEFKEMRLLEVRKLTLEDIDKLLGESRGIYSAPSEIRRPLTQFLSQQTHLITTDPGTELFIGLTGDEVTSYISMHHDETRPGTLIIDTLYVSEKYRRQGIDKSQLEEAINYARTKDSHTVLGQTSINNLPVHQLLESMGFEETMMELHDIRVSNQSQLHYMLSL